MTVRGVSIRRLVLLTILTVMLAAGSGSATAASWSAQLVPNPPGPPDGQLAGVSCVSAGYCIAVGQATSAPGGLTELWNGAEWTVLSTPALPGGPAASLRAVSCASQSFCIAVGGGAAQRWDGVSWHLLSPASSGSAVLSGVSCAGSTCIAVGYTAGSAGTSALAERFNGQRWSVMSIPRPSGITLSAVSCSSPDACTAVGDGPGQSSARPAVAERFNGVTWTTQSVPNLADPTLNVNLLQSVSCPSQLSCVAVGMVLGSGANTPGLQAFIARWDGVRWSLQSGPAGIAQPQLYGVSCSSSSSCTAFGGSGFNGVNGPHLPLGLAYDGHAWTSTPAPDPTGGAGTVTPGAVSCTRSGQCMAVGTSDFVPTEPSTRLAFSMQSGAAGFALLNTPSPATSGAGAGFFNGIACTSPSACTAVGLGASGAAAERFDGHSWSTQSTPDPAGVELSSVSCVSTVDCTAVGYAKLTRIERWTNGAWTIVPNPNPPGYSNALLTSVSCASAFACMATGVAAGGPGGSAESLAERWDGNAWTITPAPGPRGANHYPLLAAVSCTAANACIAVGGDQSQNRTLAERWNGSRWQLLRAARLTGQFRGVSCVTARDCLAVGPRLAERFNGHGWQREPSPPGQMQAVSCVSSDECTAVGSGHPPAVRGGTTAATEFNGARWTSDTPASPGSTPRLGGVACPVATSCEAVGQYNSGAGSFPLAEVSSHPLSALVKTLPASRIAHRHGTLNASVWPRGNALSSCRFQWGTTGDYTNSARCRRLPGARTRRAVVSATLRGLLPGTTYYFRLRVVSAGGTVIARRGSFTTPSHRGAFTFGNASVGPRASSFRANLERVNPYALLRGGQLQSLSIYLQPTAKRGRQTVRLMLYRDVRGVPGRLLASTRRYTFSSTDHARWYSLGALRRRALSRGRYWIGVITGGRGGVAGWRYADVGVRDTRGRGFDGGASSPFGAVRQDRAIMSLYATISRAGGPRRVARATGLFRARTVCAHRCLGRTVVPR